ncbi:MAG: HAD family hydrolase [Nitrospiria bacterium]
MLKAIIFDCDGVIADSEPHHLKAFQITLEGEGISLTKEEYYQKYLAMDDKGLFETILSAYKRPVNKTTLKRLIVRKMALYRTLSQQSLFLYPGVVEFVKKAEGLYRLAIASGAFRGEIKFILDKGGMRSAFPVIVSAQDVRNGKPHPEAFLTALAKLNALPPPIPPIVPQECVVIEDSLYGVKAARLAGMRSLAVTNTYPVEAFSGKVDRIVGGLDNIAPEDLETLCRC